MASVTKLIERCMHARTAEAALAALAALPLEQKRVEVYPPLIAIARRFFCDRRPAQEQGLDIVELAAFIMRELPAEPDLASQLYAAIGSHSVKSRPDVLCRLATHARDRRALPVLRGLSRELEWLEAVLALQGVELLDQIEQALRRERAPELAVAAAFLGGERVRGSLVKVGEHIGPVLVATAFALLANPVDGPWLTSLGGAAGVEPRAVYLALTSTKPRERLASVAQLARGIGVPRQAVGPARLLALTRVLGDADLGVVEAAAGALVAYARGHRDRASPLFHAYFLGQAARAVANGVSAAAREHLDAMCKLIPRAAPLPAGVTKERPPPKRTSTAAAKLRSAALLDELSATLPARDGSHRNLDLEALIAEEPDDPARYLVYADWLQTAGDPRGTLIVLDQLAASSNDKAHGLAAATLRDQHRDALLGRLAPYTRDRDRPGDAPVQLAWFMGFIRAARLRIPELTVLESLLDSPSARFVQELVIDPTTTPRGLDAAQIEEVLLARPPRTLAMLQIGRPGHWQVTPQLRAALPRLHRPPAEEWALVMARAAEQHRLKIDLDVLRLPALVPKVSGITIDPARVLVGLKAELEKLRPLGLLAVMPRVFTAESLDRYARALAEQWQALGDDAARWPFDALGPLGGTSSVAFLAEHLARWSHQRAVQGLEHLARIGSDAAVVAIAGLALAPEDHGYRKEVAREVLGRLATARGLASRDQLLDQACPAMLTTRGLETQRRWLESLMVSGHRIAADVFRDHVARHPARRSLVTTLLWAECVGAELVGLLRVDDTGAWRRLDGTACELIQARAHGHGIGLVHPAELSAARLDEARRDFAGVRQAVLQLERPVFALRPDETRSLELTRFARRPVGFSPIERTLTGRGWSVAEEAVLGVAAYSRRFERDQVVAVATLTASDAAVAKVHVRPHVAYAGRRGLGSLHPVTVSELLWDLELAHGRPADAARPVSVTRAAADAPSGHSALWPGAVIERAKTGRSKCFVCAIAIAKGALRIGIERLIETPSFRGRGLVWAHPHCRDHVPELAEATGLDEALATA